jgi:hypothetical protein
MTVVFVVVTKISRFEQLANSSPQNCFFHQKAARDLWQAKWQNYFKASCLWGTQTRAGKIFVAKGDTYINSLMTYRLSPLIGCSPPAPLGELLPISGLKLFPFFAQTKTPEKPPIKTKGRTQGESQSSRC